MPSGAGTLEKPFVIVDKEVIEEEVGEEEASFMGAEDNDGDGMEMDEEEELEGDAAENEVDGILGGLSGTKASKMQDPFTTSDTEMTKKEHDIPMFHARRPPHCPSNLIKVGNDRAAITKAKAKNHLKPISAIQRQTPPPLLPPRSKSEQPRGVSDRAKGGASNSRLSMNKPKADAKGNGTLSFPVVKKPKQPGSSSQGDKPKVSSSSTNPTSRGPVESSVCPICSREMQMDNEQLNRHIDYCLSKGTILEVSATTSL